MRSFFFQLVLLLALFATAASFSLANTHTFDQAIVYAKSHPTRDGGTWDQWCAAFMFRAANLPVWAARESAILAYAASKIVSKDIGAAPPGTFHWWDIGKYGHVAMSIGNGWSLMASRHVQQSWGNAMGITPVDAYTSKTGARYLGWSYDYAGAEVSGVRSGQSSSPVQPGGGGGGSGVVPKTSTSEDGIPGINYYKRLQLFASKHGYTGPIDGQLGMASWSGVQRGLRSIGGYNGPIDGAPGTNLYRAMQAVAQRYGYYYGPIDGQLGKNSYRGFAKYLTLL